MIVRATATTDQGSTDVEDPTVDDASTAVDDRTDDESHPRGTLLVTMVFLVALALAWAWMYYEMIHRS